MLWLWVCRVVVLKRCCLRLWLCDCGSMDMLNLVMLCLGLFGIGWL